MRELTSLRVSCLLQRVKALEGELANVSATIQQQLMSKDQMLQQLQDQVTLWRNKYEALAKLYSQLRNEHLEMLGKYKQMQLKANSAQEAIDKMERMERDVKAKNLELADMMRERDRARFDLDRVKSSQKDEVERLKRDLRFAEERFEDASRSKGSEVSSVMSKFNRQIDELENSLRVRLALPLVLLPLPRVGLHTVLTRSPPSFLVCRTSRTASTSSSPSSTTSAARPTECATRRTRRSPSCRRAWTTRSGSCPSSR